MVAIYLLPCACGVKHEVSARQAGQTLTCECGANVEIPTLRGLRNLQVVQPQSQPSSARWSIAKGFTFAIGTVLLVVGGGFAYSSHSGIVQRRPYMAAPQIDEQKLLEEVNAIPSDELWKIWQQLRDGDIGARIQPTFLVVRQDVKILTIVRNVALGFAALGLLAQLVSYSATGKPR